MRRALGIFACAGFCLSLIVHLTTFLGVDPAKHVPFVWALHVGIFIGFVPMIFAQGIPPKKDFWEQLMSRLPRWQRYAVKGLFAYAIINFALFFYLSEGGTPDIRDDKYVLHSHGTLIRELSADEYEWQNAYIARGFSGHWMVFYLIPAIYFLQRKPGGSHL
ncbi:MAG TPA: hypothetical protein VGO68_18855 [Pyrinomonadaceae bacterium]|nr:hypothetical protein [Pyrinomonadaceae bacterium]